MVSLLESIYEYQTLLHRQQDDLAPLTDQEQARLVGLRRLLSGEYLGPEPEPEGEPHRTIPVHFTVPGAFGSGEIRSLSAAGMAIVTNRPLAVDTRTILRVADPLGGLEYVFPGRVVWSKGRVLGVAFDGAPRRAPFLLPAESWRPGRLRLGGGRASPISA